MPINKKTNFLFLFLLLILILGTYPPPFLIEKEGINDLTEKWWGAYALEVKYPVLPYGPPPPTSQSTLPDYVNYIFFLSIGIGLTLALGLLIYGGVLYIISLNNPDRINSAREWIKSAFFGLLILFTSILVLDTINPQFSTLKLSPIEKIELIKKEEVPPLELESILSSIHIKLPFGQIIMKIFETYISDISPKEQKIPRMLRIKENANTTFNIAEKLKSQNEELKKLTEQCLCYLTAPVGNSCSSDPCLDVRQKFEDIEKQNLSQIELLKQVQKETIAESGDLEKELRRLQRTEEFIRYCPTFLENSYSQFLFQKQSYINNGGVVREIDFWNDIQISYRNKKGVMEDTDWATLVCLIGGTILSTTEPSSEEEIKKPPESETLEEPESCSSEMPVGEIIDRAKNTSWLLGEKLKELILLNKEMIKAVDQMQVLISQCSSQRCQNIGNICDGEPCPRQEIVEQFKKIEQIFHLIDKTVKNPKPQEKGEEVEIGIIPMINPDDPNSVASKILEDLDKIADQKENSGLIGIRSLRYSLKTCENETQSLYNCQRAVGKLDSYGKQIGTCCFDEPAYRMCVDECYLESGGENYKKCLEGCLIRKSNEAKAKGIIRPEEISRCRPLLNFYCCKK